MKVIGMYFIIAGHFFPPGHQYIYAFNVPLFFVISGYLWKREENSVFVRKSIENLVIPMLCFTALLGAYSCWHVFRRGGDWVSTMLMLPVNTLIGDQDTLKACWFIYTLVILRVFFQLVTSKTVLMLVTIAAVAASLRLNDKNIANSWTNVFLAYPFYLGGVI